MALSISAKFTCFLIGLLIGGGVVFVALKLTRDSSNDKQDKFTNTTGSRVNDSLQFVIVVSRHGNRGGKPNVDYPDDPYPINNTKYWPYGPEGLTPVGRKQEYKLGKKLRALYNGFLSSTFHSDDIYACSDLYERVVMSGDLVLAGLYPPHGWQVWDSSINWQPIALYTNSSDHSLIIDNCPRYLEEKLKSMAKFLVDDAVNITYLTNYFYNKTGVNYTDDDLFYLFEKVISEVTEGYPITEWMKMIYPDRFTDFYKKQFVAKLAGTDEVSRLWVGNMLGEMIDSMASKVNGSSSRKMSYYSGHDVTIINLQISLGIPRSDIVKLVTPGSALLLELHRDPYTSQYSVQVLFIDGWSSDLEPQELSLAASCGKTCTFDTLVNITRRFTNVNYEEECQLFDDISTHQY